LDCFDDEGGGMPVYFNNSRGKNHAALYGKDAFYDLYTTQRGPKSLTPGQKCVVAIRAKNKAVSFRYFLFSHAGVSQYDGRPCRVFYGNFTKQSGPYSQKDAALIEPIFFNKNGHFNQWAVLER
jgi:hypothetical protein